MWPQDRKLHSGIRKIHLNASDLNGLNDFANKRIEFLKQSNCVKILPTRGINLMIDIQHRVGEYLPESFSIHLLRQNDFGYSYLPVHWRTLKSDMSKDQLLTKFRILEIERNRSNYLVDRICFDSHGQLENDVTLGIEVKYKYVYEIHAGRYRDVLFTDDGGCNHEEGDTFPDGKGNEITVMDIDHENGIVFCSATGFLYNM